MKKFIKWLLWNVLITGTLIAGYYLEAQSAAGVIIGIMYVFILSLLFVGIMVVGYAQNHIDNVSAKSSKAIQDTKPRITLIADVLFIFIAKHLGYNKIALAMVFELFASIVIYYQAYLIRQKLIEAAFTKEEKK